jgi:hypothetical protein
VLTVNEDEKDKPLFMEPATTKLDYTISPSDEEELYHILYSGLNNISDLVECLTQYLPQNAWQLYLSHYDTIELFMLNIEKTIKVDASLEEHNKECLTLKDAVEKFIKNAKENESTLWKLFDDTQKKLLALIKKNNDHWNRAIFYILIFFYTKIRGMLDNYSRSFGYMTGYSKTEKLNTATNLMTFLTSSEPLLGMDKWLDEHHKGMKESLKPGYGYFTDRLTNIYLSIQKSADTSAEAIKMAGVTPAKPASNWVGMVFGY